MFAEGNCMTLQWNKYKVLGVAKNKYSEDPIEEDVVYQQFTESKIRGTIKNYRPEFCG